MANGRDNPSLQDEEARVQRELEPELRDHIALVVEAYNLTNETQRLLPWGRVTGLTLSRRVASVLLLRASNDVHAAAKLIAQGYPLQGATVVASAFEHALTIIYIGSDESRAQAWTEHDDPKRAFVSVSSLIESAVDVDGLSESQRAALEKTYAQLSMAKHGNPILQKAHGTREDEETVELRGGPESSEGSVRVGWYSCEHGAQLLNIAIHATLREHATGKIPEDFRTRLSNLQERRRELNRRARERWGSEDPYGGVWGKGRSR